MPLSEHEQRLLEQIEQALYAEDPKFASIYRSTDVRSHYRRRLARAAALVVAGMALLLAGVVTQIVPLGVAGFIVMLGGATWAVASWQRMIGRVDRADPAPAPPAAGAAFGGSQPSDDPWAERAPSARATQVPRRTNPPGRRRSWREALEERWERRRDTGGF